MARLGVIAESLAGRRILLTGHSGFKGAWAGRWLAAMGAEVTGLSLAPDTDPALAEMLGYDHLAASHFGDLRDPALTARLVAQARPEIVLHMAAQPIVRLSYEDPVGTFGSNVMGTVHLLDALRGAPDLRAVLVVTSDKVYENDESGRAFAEGDTLGGHDPYSASKAATEIAVSSFARSFFPRIPVATARGGNVVGGGDFATDRLVPDIVRAARAGQPLTLRNPHATRPWQHVLDCLHGYFAYTAALLRDESTPRTLNFGPLKGSVAVSVAEVADRLHHAMGIDRAATLTDTPQPHEMATLAIDPTRAQTLLGWHPRLDTDMTLSWIAEWYGAWMNGADMAARTDDQIARFEELTR